VCTRVLSLNSHYAKCELSGSIRVDRVLFLGVFERTINFLLSP